MTVDTNLKHFNFKDRVGQKFITNQGYEIEIVEYFGAKNTTVQFLDSTKVYNVEYRNIITGQVGNPMRKSYYKKGFIGIGSHKVIINGALTKKYSIWRGIMTRGYCEKFKERNKTYKECLVDERWHNFQVFADWFEENHKSYMDDNWHLDKDILMTGNKIYSPETCCFVPHEINLLFLKNSSRRGLCPIGVSEQKGRFYVQLSRKSSALHLGGYSTAEKAAEVYKINKEEYIKQLADNWRGKITESCYEALINYKVYVTD